VRVSIGTIVTDAQHIQIQVAVEAQSARTPP
jgi:hypothetical protein